MPIISPSDKESEQNFVSRCMDSLKDENKPQNVKLGICYTSYKNIKKKKQAKGDLSEPSWNDVEKNGFIIFP